MDFTEMKDKRQGDNMKDWIAIRELKTIPSRHETSN